MGSPDDSYNLRELHSAFSLPCSSEGREALLASEWASRVHALQTDFRRQWSTTFARRLLLPKEGGGGFGGAAAAVQNGTSYVLERTEEKFFQSFNVSEGKMKRRIEREEGETREEQIMDSFRYT